jgi:phosphoglycolate phosphatase-like HAD superfamily hydrolase
MSDLKAVIFDFDGTLVQLRPGPGKMDELRDRLGILFAEVGIRSTLRPFYPEVDRALGALRHLDDAQRTRVRSGAVALIEEYELEFSRNSEPCPYAAQTWKAVATRFPCAVASNNTRLTVQRSLRRHGIWDADTSVPLVGFEDVERHKPDPAALARLAETLRLGPGDVAAHVGDHVNDLEACRTFNQQGRAQLVPVMVQGGKCRWEDVVAHPGFHPTRAIADLSQLLPLLESRACSR